MSSPRFRIFETTADTGLFVWGVTKEELFENAAAGLFQVIASPLKVRPLERCAVETAGIDDPSRLVAWLSEWLYLFDARGFIGCRFRIGRMGGRVAGEGWGEIFDRRRHTLRTEVKGITYHRIEICRSGSRHRARLVLDI